MNKSELVKLVAETTNLTQVDVEKTISATINEITKALIERDKVSIAGFLKFEVKDVPAKEGTIQLGDKKGEKWYKEATKKVVVKPLKTLKESIFED